MLQPIPSDHATPRRIVLLSCGSQLMLALVAGLDRREMKRHVRRRDQLGERVLLCRRYGCRRGFPPIRLQRCVSRKVDRFQLKIFIPGNCHINRRYHMPGLGHPRTDGRGRSGGGRASRSGRTAGPGRWRVRGICRDRGRLCGWTRRRGRWIHRCLGGIRRRS